MRKKTQGNSDFVHGAIFRSPDPNKWFMLATGSGNKKSKNYGIPTKTITRDEGLRIKKELGMGQKRDQYGSYGYQGFIPKKFFL